MEKIFMRSTSVRKVIHRFDIEKQATLNQYLKEKKTEATTAGLNAVLENNGFPGQRGNA